ncbi:chromatin assembly factor 1 subunit A-B isoform X2 [Aphidius gifuensis]|uniref:chromatin assembly factor 1 subunit A-B isoform X2 n=1 Tax=Aphidius gifuensis TaxID=684658 RepID=UPI001CDCCAA5|nr:chromatin assembly factor 1 subunit A-B isoform X2 [Aphidius gifuensis]
MESNKEHEESVALVLQPPKEKKLKQTRLPFQTVSSLGSPNTSNKKRKLSSPSPTSCKSPKVQKIGKKENSLKFAEVIDVESIHEKDNKTNEVDVNVNSIDSSDIASHLNDKKTNSTKHGDISKFLTKISVVSTKVSSPVADKKSQVSSPAQLKVEVENKLPIVLLNRCDDGDSVEPMTVSNDSLDNLDKTNVVCDESSNDVLAEPLPDSDNDEDQNSLDKTQDSSSDSEIVTSTSEDDTQDDKKSDDDDDEKKINNEKSTNDMADDKSQSTDKKPESVIKKKRALTQKQIEKKLASAKKRELQKEAKAEKEKQTELQKLQRRKEREEKKKETLKKKEAEIEAKKKEREQKELKKQIEIEQKQKEREQKEEEKRKKEEEKLEAERKKQKVSSTFKNFFVPKKLDNKINEEIKTSNFMPFEIKADMKIAPACRRNFNDEDKLNFDNNCLIKKNEYTDQLWLDEVRKNHSKIRKSGKTWPTESKDDDIIALEDDVDNINVVDQSTAVTEKQRAKLLSFTENRRPPYWGTWRKKSDKINPKKPFNKDTKWFDYDVDSDEEWEEEEPGESLCGSDEEKEEENADDNEYDVDNEFMVPHGYLSDEEARPDEEDEEDMTPETQKFKLKILGEQFQAEMNEKTAKIKPRVIGILWQNMENNYPDNTPEKVVKYMTARQAWVREIPIELTKPLEVKIENEKVRGPKKTRLPDEALSHLIKLIHGNRQKREFLVNEFITFWSKTHGDDAKLTKSSIDSKISEIAKRIPCPDEGLMHLKNCWYVSEEIRKQYLDEEIKLPNQWSYNLTPKRKTILDDSFDKTDKDIKEQKDKIEKDLKDKKNSSSLITQFTQKITTEELKKQFKPTSPSVKTTNSLNRPPKRATLISVPRGELIPPTSNFPAFNKIPEIIETNQNNNKDKQQTDEIILD